MTPSLTGPEREFLTLVSRAAYSNPFSAERAALDAQIARTPGDEPDQLDRLLARLRGRLAAIDDRVGGARLSTADQALLAHGTFFDAFHRASDAFDGLITEQLAAGPRRVAVPFASAILTPLVARGLSPARAERVLGFFWQMRRAFYFIQSGLVGRSPAMGALREALWSSVFTHDVARYERYLWDRLEDFSTLILGETGTGKGAAAAAIGRSGYIAYEPSRGAFAASFTDTFVPVNLAEYSEALIESALFGHSKGAFTGAIDDHDGVLARCRKHGAILLDEIGEVSEPVQVKLLQVLQTRQFTPVGGRSPGRFAGRIIAATHRDVDALRAEGRLRDDFYYRLCADVIRVPTLRDRLAEAPEELAALVDTLTTRIVGAPSPELAAEVTARIDADLGPHHPWPGNVRELEQTIRRVLLTGRCAPRAAPSPASVSQAQPFGGGALTAREVLDRYCAQLYAQHGTYEQVARITGLDRRTVKKHVLQGQPAD